MNNMCMLCGLPGSGKSTYAEKLKEKGYIIHSSDKIREEFGDVNDQSKNVEVFDILHKRIKDDLRNGKNVVYDATSLNRKRRVAFLRELKNISCKKVCVLVATPYEMCVVQNFKRKRRVPVEVIWRMYLSFDMPSIYEGFDEVIIYYPNEEWKEYYGDIITYVRNLTDFNQENSHHKLSLGNHMLKAMDNVLYFNSRYYDNVVLAALSHDIGKVETKTFENTKGEVTEEAHYYSHENVGSYKSLFFEYPDYADKEYIALLIGLHMKPYVTWKQSEKAYNKDLDLFGQTVLDDIKMIHTADVSAH